MVTLISLGDSGLKEDKSVKLADIVMPEREIDTFMDEVDKPDEPEEQPEDIAQPEVDLQPTTGIDVNIPKPKAKFTAGGSFFRDGEYIPLFKIQPQYPRRAQERGTMGFAIVAFTITESGTIEDAVPVEGYCTTKNPNDPEAQLRPCSIFNSASTRAAPISVPASMSSSDRPAPLPVRFAVSLALVMFYPLARLGRPRNTIREATLCWYIP